MESPSSTSSLVSKAKTAFHSAAAKAERVYIDLKSNNNNNNINNDDDDQKKNKNDHHQYQSDNEGGEQSHNNTSKKPPPSPRPTPSPEVELEGEDELKTYRRSWKSAPLGRKQDWQDRLNKIRRIKTTEERDNEREKKSPVGVNGNVNVCDFDEYLDQMNFGTCIALRGTERESSAEKEKPCVDTANYIAPTATIKQLAVAIESSKKFKAMKDLLVSARDSSPVRERASLSFSAMKSLVLRDKEDKSELVYDDEILSLSHSLFKPEGNSPSRRGPGTSSSSLLKDIHGAPLESFVVKLSEIMGNLKTLKKMTLFWCRVVAELRRLWFEGQPVPLVPQDGHPDLRSCLLYQQLQVINCCISRKNRRLIASEALDSIMKEACSDSEDLHNPLGIVPPSLALYARINTGELVLRLGAHRLSENLTMLETGEPMYAPVTQEGPVLTEDLIRETEEFILRTGSVGVGCSQLLSDMQAFKAANPGCILEDFVRWHSPPDWTETDPSNEARESPDSEDSQSRRGQLSSRMQTEGNLWLELWGTAKPLPAVKQTPLFDEDLAVEGILSSLEKIVPYELFKQLFISLLGAGFAIAEGVLSTSSNLSKLFTECKEYTVATCQGEALSENIDDLCQVYETVETILLYPEDGLKIMNQSEESSVVNERKHRFKKLNLNFVTKDRNFFRSPGSKLAAPEDNSSRQLFTNLTSPFSKKPPKPTNIPIDNVPTCIVEDNDWTMV